MQKYTLQMVKLVFALSVAMAVDTGTTLYKLINLTYMKKPSEQKKHIYSLRITEDLRYEIEELARREGVKASKIVNKAIENYLNTNKLQNV